MRHRLFRRILAAACGLWLALSLAEPAGLHACEMHAAHGQAHGQAHAAAHHHASHGKDARATTCTCLGGCCVAVAISAPAAAPLVATITVAHAVRVAASPVLGRRSALVEHARPPTIGPPAHTA